MKIAILTSSRADYGIYLPLLKKLNADSFFDSRIIAFGTHPSYPHGHTIDTIIADGFTIDHQVEHVLPDDSAMSISKSMATASLKFSAIWEEEKNNYDLVFCLGDRYEMFAAVSAAVPFNIKFAHIHGGETTLGAIDNTFRHCLSIFSSLHFVATKQYAKKVALLKGDTDHIHVIGALSLDNLKDLRLLSPKQFFEFYKINLNLPTILVTYHPETLNAGKSEYFAKQLTEALTQLENYQFIITMPNADTMSNSMRKVYEQFAESNSKVFVVENFGTLAYFSCMKHCKFVLGNSSSGIIEAASFKKHAVDIGNRQLGRVVSGNIIHSNNDTFSIVTACKEAEAAGNYKGRNIYFKKNAAESIINILKNEWNGTI